MLHRIPHWFSQFVYNVLHVLNMQCEFLKGVINNLSNIKYQVMMSFGYSNKFAVKDRNTLAHKVHVVIEVKHEKINKYNMTQLLVSDFLRRLPYYVQNGNSFAVDISNIYKSASDMQKICVSLKRLHEPFLNALSKIQENLVRPMVAFNIERLLATFHSMEIRFLIYIISCNLWKQLHSRIYYGYRTRVSNLYWHA